MCRNIPMSNSSINLFVDDSICLHLPSSLDHFKSMLFVTEYIYFFVFVQEVIAAERDMLKQSLELLVQDIERLKQDNEALMKDKEVLLRDIEERKDAEEFEKLEEESKKEYEVFEFEDFFLFFLIFVKLLLCKVSV